MTQVIIDKFDGGIAEDVRTHNTDECEVSRNFDVFTNPHKLIPFGDSIADTATGLDMNDIRITDVNISANGITATGYESAISTKPTFYTKTDVVTAFTKQIAAAGNQYVPNSLVVYRDKDFCLGWNSGAGTYTLYRFDSVVLITSCGTLTAAGTGSLLARPFVHPEDNMLYIVIGTVITRYDGVNNIGSGASLSYSSILPTGLVTTSVCDYGTYLAIGMQHSLATGNSVCYLWGRDGTLNTLQATIDCGEGNLRIVENLDNNLIFIMTAQDAFFSALTPRMLVKIYQGGVVTTLKTIPLASTNVAGNSKIKNSTRLYIAFGADDCVYAIGKNKSGNYIVTKDRYLFNGTTVGGTLAPYLSMIGDIMWRAFETAAGVFSLYRSRYSSMGETISYNSTSIYRTTINPNMRIQDRYDNKQLDSVRLAFTGAVSGTTTVKYSVDGSAFATLFAYSNAAGETVREAATQDNGDALLQGREIQFQIECTGGSQIKELAYSYSVLPTLAN